MSAAAGSGKQANLFSEEVEALYDPYAGFALNNACSEIPWPEWSDAELNAESWDEGKSGKSTAAAVPKNASTVLSYAFTDPKPPVLPHSISDYVMTWKRPNEVFPNEELTVFDPSNGDFELQTPSNFSSSFFKAFIEQTTILQYYAAKYRFQVELETPTFVANTQGEIWRPWHHVYAMCKAGKGQVHKPLYCPFGKYVVRLFYLGAWRRFVVDDKIPCDVEGNCMLPITQILGELWPIILTKALLKILSLTPSGDFSTADFPILSLFTGWTFNHFATDNKTFDQVWRRLTALIPRFEQSENNPHEKSSTHFGKTPTVKESAKKESRKSQDKESAHVDRFCFLLGHLIGFEENLPINSMVAIMMARECPLVNAKKREGTKPWKRIRWIYWAKEKGLWLDENLLPPYRRLQIITFSPQLSDLLTPDPKLEAALYEIPDESGSNTDEELSAGDSRVFEPEQWCDYFKLTEYLFGINVFFKPSYFINSFRVTCLKERVPEIPYGGKGTSKALPPPQNLYVFPTVLKQTFNEPAFLFCEALTGIFLCFSLWVCPEGSKKSFGYLEADQPKILKVGHASMLIEVFDWKSVVQGEIVGLVKTVGCSSTFLNLKPGRHILKLWIESDSPYVVEVYSNVNVAISKSSRIRFLMSTESQQILSYINNVSNSFMALTQKFGKPDLPTGLRDFYDIIFKPKNDIIFGYRLKMDDFIESFLNCILLSVKDLFPNVEEVVVMMWALRSLFINPNIHCDLPPGGPPPSVFGGSTVKKLPKKVVPVLRERTLSEIMELASLPGCDRKVVMIQRIFRGYRVRLLWKCQSPGRREFKPFTDRLKKICDAIFIPQKREMEVGKLLRRLVMTKPDLLTIFRFHRDFYNVLQVEEFSGKIPNVEPFAWVPIARFVVACHCEGLVPCDFKLSCNLEQSFIQGFDNDTGVEIFRATNAVSPHCYESNVKGYTIFVFGWNEANVKTVNWRLEMVKMKHFQSMHLCNLLMSPICLPYSMPNLDIFELRNFYVPNSKSRILRCLIKIQKRTLLTLRLSMSYTDVQFSVVITLNKNCEPNYLQESSTYDEVLVNISSTNGSVIVPSLVLEYVDSSCYGETDLDVLPTVYVLEAFVQNDSWPLTKQEWGLVEPLRVSGEYWKDSITSIQSKKGGSESRKKISRFSKKSTSEQKVENPFWQLQALNDSTGSDSGELPVIEEDKTYAEFVRTMKMSWEEKDPGRRKRGREMRMKFLYEMYLEEKKKDIYYGEGYGEDGGQGRGEVFIQDPKVIVDRLSSFSYLTNDITLTRFTYSPRILPVTPLLELLCRYKKIEEPEEIFPKYSMSFQQPYEGSSTVYLQVVEDLLEVMEEERKEYLRQCLYYRSVMADFMTDEQKLSNRLMDQAYDARSKVLERMMR